MARKQRATDAKVRTRGVPRERRYSIADRSQHKPRSRFRSLPIDNRLAKTRWLPSRSPQSRPGPRLRGRGREGCEEVTVLAGVSTTARLNLILPGKGGIGPESTSRVEDQGSRNEERITRDLGYPFNRSFPCRCSPRAGRERHATLSAGARAPAVVLARLSGADGVLVTHLFAGVGDSKHPGEPRPGTRVIRGRNYVPDSG